MGNFEMTIKLHAILESNCPTNVTKTYDQAVTILTNYIEDEMSLTTNSNKTYTAFVNDARLMLEHYKQAQLEVSLSIQMNETTHHELIDFIKQIKNKQYVVNNFHLYNGEEDEVYHCKISKIKDMYVPIETILQLEVAV